MSTLSGATEIRHLVAALKNERKAQAPAQFPVDRAEAGHAGLYSWWADSHGVKALGAVLGGKLQPLIYVGQAGATRWPSGTRSAATLASRIGSQHIRGNARSSTFRLTISALLREVLGLDIDLAGRLDPVSNAAYPAGSLNISGSQSCRSPTATGSALSKRQSSRRLTRRSI